MIADKHKVLQQRNALQVSQGLQQALEAHLARLGAALEALQGAPDLDSYTEAHSRVVEEVLGSFQASTGYAVEAGQHEGQEQLVEMAQRAVEAYQAP